MGSIGQLQQALAAGCDQSPPGLAPRGRSQAAVLALIADSPTPELLFTRRAFTLRSHPGQISFPGGRMEEGEDAPMAACREAQEEIGLDPRHVTVLGELARTHVVVSGFDVHTVVATWDGRARLGRSNESEVAGIHRITIADLADPNNRCCVRLGLRYCPAWSFAEVFIWGMTGHRTDALLRLGGWEEPWDRNKVVPVRSGFGFTASI